MPTTMTLSLWWTSPFWSTTFSKCQGYAGYDDRADFNEDNCVTLLDFSLLATNFGQGGPIIITSNPESDITAPGRTPG